MTNLPGPYKWAFFDLDNTLFDFDYASEHAFKDVCTKLGQTYTPAYYQEYKIVNKRVWGELETGELTADQVKKERWRRFFGSQLQGITASETNDFYLERLVEKAKFEEGALEIMDSLRQAGIKMVAITNGFKKVQRPRIEKAGVTDYFESIVVSEEIAIAKPSVKFFDYALATVDNPPKQEILIIGDSLSSDMAGAVNAGIDACWYNPKRTINNTTVRPQFEIQSLEALNSIFGIT